MSKRNERARRMWASAFNLPNQLTSYRLLLAIVMFCLIAWEHYLTSLVLFVIATGTDWLDGYFARKYQQVTTLGRILDPFVDKVIVCGTFIFVIAAPHSYPGLRPWMVVVIVGRELLITALRNFVEDQGSDFSAKMAGKLKMVLQCVAAGACLLYLHYSNPDVNAPAVNMPGWAWTVMVVSLWSSIVLTVYSGVDYIWAAVRLMRSSR